MKRLNLLVLLAICAVMIAAPAATAQVALPTISGDVQFNLTGTIYDSMASAQFLATDQTSIGRRDIGWLVYTDKHGTYKLKLDDVYMTCCCGGAVMSGYVIRSTHWNYDVGKHVHFWVWDGDLYGGRPDEIAPDLPQTSVIAGDLKVENYEVGCP
jgi:opacity protein-like surface antigen